MIACLRGRVFEKHPNRIILDVGGVGYDVIVPLSTFYATGEVDEEITLRVHTHVREDQLALFGFATLLELGMFERLIGVSGIGPKLAIGILSGIETRELAGAIQRGDIARLTRIPGVGKKTAERVAIELRDRLPKALEAAGADTATAGHAQALRDDVASALVNLGYHRQSIDKALETLLGTPDRVARADAGTAAPTATFEDVLRSALKELSRA